MAELKQNQQPYRLTRFLGSGGIGKVYLADEGDRPVAVKFLENSLDPKLRGFFREEVRLLSLLSHPNLVKIYDYFETDTKTGPRFSTKDSKIKAPPRGPAYSMEYVEGQSLDHLPRETSAEAWIDILAQICHGLHYLHSRNILHRDLKPSNILRKTDGQIKILDFSISVSLQSRATGPAQMGTPNYMPPEAFRGEFDFRGDLFSLGVLFYSLLTGKFPFDRPLTPAGIRDLAPREPLARVRKDLPEYFCDMIDRLLELSPLQRPSSALTLLRILQEHTDRPIYRFSEEESVSIFLKTPLVGRERELKIFVELSAPDAKSEGPKAFILHGPTGVGRSRLIEAFKWQHLLEGTPFFTLEPKEASTWISSLLQKLAPGKALDNSSDFLSALETLQQKLNERYTVLAFTDLHEWPESSLQQLKILWNALSRSRTQAAVIFEYNSERKEWELEGQQVHDLALKDLSPSETQQLIVQSVPGVPLPKSWMATIAHISGGRPLLILEVLRQALALGKIEESPEKLSLPKNFKEASRQRVERLDDPSRKLLALLVVHSEPVAAEMLHELWSGSKDQLEAAILELDAKGFTAPRGLKAREILLRHPSLKPTLQAALPAETIQSGHREWLDYLLPTQALTPSDDDHLIALLEHALALKEVSVLIKFGLEALAALARQGNYAKAIEWSDSLLEIPLPTYNRMATFAHRAPYLNRLGRYAEALEAYDRWYELREDDESRLQKVKYLFLTAWTFYAARRESEAKQRLTECLATGDSQAHAPQRPFHARAHNLLAALAEKQGRWEEARSHLAQALPLGKDDPLLMSETEQRLGALESTALHFPQAELHFQEAMKYAQVLKNPQVEALSWQSLAMVEKDQGRLKTALSSVERALELAKRGGEIPQWTRYVGNRGAVRLEAGDLAGALEDFRRSEEMLKIVGGETEQFIAQIQMASAFLLLGNRERFEGMKSSLEKNIERLRSLSLEGYFLSLQGESVYLKRQYPEARDFFHKSAKTLPPAAGMAQLQSRWGEFKSVLRAGYIPDAGLKRYFETPSTENVIPLLVWGELCRFFSKSPEGLSKDDFLRADSVILRIENPAWRLDLFQLIALHLHRLGFKTLSQKVATRCRQEWSQWLQNLPEEYKMDFEKNQNLRDFETELEKSPEPPQPLPPLPSPAVESRPGRPQISEARFRQFCEINRQITQKSDLSEILERVMGAAIELTGSERGYLLLKNPTVKKGPIPGFEVQTARNINQKNLTGGDLQFSFSVVKEAMDRGAPLLTDNAQKDERFRSSKSVHQLQLQSILVVPLEIEKEIIGALYLDHRYQPECFSPEDIVMISGFASQAALAIHKARLMEKLRVANEKLELRVQDQAQQIEVLSEELTQSRNNLRYEYSDIVGKSPAMMKVFEKLDHVTQTKIPIWIWGESGTGKELIARSLHFNSARKNGPFVAENCGAIPENLLESELFGYKKGAFTHAERDRVGLLEQASGGTLFLDEVADMSLGMQVKLLRVLQEEEVRPLGSNKSVKIDVRLVTASNKDLQQMVQEGNFRQDLFYRINGMTLRLPPLRERREDIPLLVHFFVKKIAKQFELKPSEIRQEAFQILMDHSWPGNIRELEAVVRNMLLFAQGKPIGKDFFSHHEGLFGAGKSAPSASSVFPPEEFSGKKGEKRQQLIAALIRHRMDKEKVAEDLDISLKSVYYRMETFGMPIKKKELREYLEREGR